MTKKKNDIIKDIKKIEVEINQLHIFIKHYSDFINLKSEIDRLERLIMKRKSLYLLYINNYKTFSLNDFLN